MFCPRMIADLFRLLLGLLIIFLHRPIADWILRREQEMASWFSHHGVNLPEFPSNDFAHNLYFCIGIFMACFSMARIWMEVLVR